jgi:hypothetical protein
VTKKGRETLIALAVGIPIALAIAVFVPAVGWPRYRAARCIDKLLNKPFLVMDREFIPSSEAMEELESLADSHPKQLVRYLDDDRPMGWSTVSGEVASVLLQQHGDSELTQPDIDAVELDFVMGTAAVTSHTEAHAHFLSFCERWHAWAAGDGPRPGVH